MPRPMNAFSVHRQSLFSAACILSALSTCCKWKNALDKHGYWKLAASGLFLLLWRDCLFLSFSELVAYWTRRPCPICLNISPAWCWAGKEPIAFGQWNLNLIGWSTCGLTDASKIEWLSQAGKSTNETAAAIREQEGKVRGNWRIQLLLYFLSYKASPCKKFTRWRYHFLLHQEKITSFRVQS